MTDDRRLTKEEKLAYRKAFAQALKETQEAFPDLTKVNLNEAIAFRDRRTCELILASPGRLQNVLRDVLLPKPAVTIQG